MRGFSLVSVFCLVCVTEKERKKEREKRKRKEEERKERKERRRNKRKRNKKENLVTKKRAHVVKLGFGVEPDDEHSPPKHHHVETHHELCEIWATLAAPTPKETNDTKPKEGVPTDEADLAIVPWEACQWKHKRLRDRWGVLKILPS
jgi:hypothetical protein